MTFSGFAASDLAFLTGLAANNDRDWFTAHRAAYDEGLKPGLAALIEDLNPLLAARGLPLRGDARKSQFRIHRDVRFSNDKCPYKVHVAATVSRTGPDGEWRKMSPGMVYIHIEPEGGSRAPVLDFDPDSIDPLDPSTLPSARGIAPDAATEVKPNDEGDYSGSGPFVAAGFWLSERPNIDAVRRAMVANPAAYFAMVEALEKAGLELAPGDPVKKMPRDFADQSGGPLDPALKRTRWIVRRRLTGAEIGSDALPRVVAAFAADARPLLEFGWKALGAGTGAGAAA
ncbi:DUF2461 domain-containing protein [Brevundimonas goettingensis]|uniref:DUF2461 domain-containing protein n=1 Tax=Brevundimonas goettingensis TaxID=2774190 RepID=A0A975C232_9CAUL|nr:TIGR02453 family protein [Brevundimonas goettingensis]QTC90405.1 DUF2461 domain-containing protein [Brevundimonas goettingensis]